MQDDRVVVPAPGDAGIAARGGGLTDVGNVVARVGGPPQVPHHALPGLLGGGGGTRLVNLSLL